MRGNILNFLGRKEESYRDYSIAININPHFAVAYNNRGLYY